jgi:hypothetical protein
MTIAPYSLPPTEYVVLSSSAHMPTKCWGRYRRVGVLEVERGYRPRQISEHPRKVVRIVRTWEKRFDGKTFRCAAERAYDAALDLATRLDHEALLLHLADVSAVY